MNNDRIYGEIRVPSANNHGRKYHFILDLNLLVAYHVVCQEASQAVGDVQTAGDK